MDWTTTAILSAAVLGVVNILDSHLINHRLPGLRAFLFPVSLFYLVYAVPIFLLYPLPASVSGEVILVALLSGILRAAAVILTMSQLLKGEVSQVIPVVYTSPIFVAVLAVLFLGERISALHWLAIILVVVGAVLVNQGRAPVGLTRRSYAMLPPLVAASLLFALADITSKYVLQYISFWHNFYLSAFCLAGAALAISVRPRVLRSLWEIPDRNATLGLLAVNEALAPFGVLLAFWAIEHGPVSLVSTITASRPVFVVIYSLVLGRFLPDILAWFSSNRNLWLRLGASLLIFSGIALIYLT
ncbi:MAG: EamA family transporter [Chloroflexota bacterium]